VISPAGCLYDGCPADRTWRGTGTRRITHVRITATSETASAPDGSITGRAHAWPLTHVLDLRRRASRPKPRRLTAREEMERWTQTNVDIVKNSVSSPSPGSDGKKEKFLERWLFPEFKDAALTLHFTLPRDAGETRELAWRCSIPTFSSTSIRRHRDRSSWLGATGRLQNAFQRTQLTAPASAQNSANRMQGGDGSNFGAMFGNKSCGVHETGFSFPFRAKTPVGRHGGARRSACVRCVIHA